MDAKPNTETPGEKKRRKFFEMPSVAESILKFLPHRVICTCAKVCSSWMAIAKFIARKRNYIFIILMNEDFMETLSSCMWIKPKVAICFGDKEYQERLDRNFEGMLHREGRSEEGSHYRHLKQECMELLEKQATKNNSIRSSLPNDCWLVRFTRDFLQNFFPSDLLSPITVLIPSIPGVEVEPFILPHRTDMFFGLREMIEPLCLSRGTSCLESKAKCLLVFRRFQDVNDVINMCRETSVGKYITEETIVIVGRSKRSSVCTGIAFAGERVRVECVRTNGKICCTRGCLAMLGIIGIGNESGLAFLVRGTVAVNFRSIFKMWSTFFPNITLLCRIYDFQLNSVLRSTILLPQECGECGASICPTGSENTNTAFVFILFLGVVCENVSN